MQIKYLGPSDKVIVVPYGPHGKGDVKEYPDDFAEELLATSIKQKFEKTPEPELKPAVEDVQEIVLLKKAGKKGKK